MQSNKGGFGAAHGEGRAAGEATGGLAGPAGRVRCAAAGAHVEGPLAAPLWPPQACQVDISSPSQHVAGTAEGCLVSLGLL